MTGYLDSFRNLSTGSGMGESPASQRRTVRSSRSSTSVAKRRADRPDASIAFARRSWGLHTGWRLLTGEGGQIIPRADFARGTIRTAGTRAHRERGIAVRFENAPALEAFGIRIALNAWETTCHLASNPAGLNCPDPSKLGHMPSAHKPQFQRAN